MLLCCRAITRTLVEKKNMSQNMRRGVYHQNIRRNAPHDKQSFTRTVNVTIYYTERQKKHPFFRVTFTEIHCIKITHIWAQIR